MEAKFISPTLIAGFITIVISCKKNLNNNNTITDNIVQGALVSQPDQKIIEPDFTSAVFTNSTSLTNIYFPYNTIGKKYVFEGTTQDGFEQDEIQRINAEKVILNIPVAVISDRAFLDGILEEDTRDWYAQDDAGNVWYMGETVDNYNPDGTLRDHEGSWEAGINNAKAGIIMLADLKQGTSYQQEFAPDIAEDKAKIEALGITVEVPFNTYENCLKTKEWSDLEKGTIEYKFYAPHVGIIMEKIHNGSLNLVNIIN